jgi:hypothetical protein
VPLLTEARRDRLKVAVLVLGGLGMVGGGIAFTVANLAFLRTAARSPGEVVAISKERGVRGMPIHFAIVRHRPAGSPQPTEFKAKPGLWPSPFAVGDPVDVAYEPADPANAKIVSFWTLWFLPDAMVALGLLCVVAGWDTWRRRARAG